jgi:uncharacterized lipoprotein YddW (UPF0748 family)
MKKNILLLFLLFLFISFQIRAQEIYPKREFRSAWVATVANIDWPSSRHLTSGQQIAELVDMFDKLKDAGINSIIFQVRTECDALYESPFEPWAYWLTGDQGKAPSPYFDPLEFAVAEAHARGMELHAWFNPYRAVKRVGDYEASEDHISKQKPEWMLDFGNYFMLDPGIPEVRDFIAAIIGDVARRYDVDGIHFDDYFYPYSPVVSNEDSITFAKYNNGYTDVHDWRRYNINSMVAQCYDSIKAIKPDVKFGISPFGIVKNEYAGTQGLNSYDVLYCDPLTWIKDKTVDYITPQLYWHIGRDVADYKDLLPWWASIVEDRHLYVGHFSSRFARRDGDRSEIGRQVRMNRGFPTVTGSVYFSAKSISNNSGGFADTLKENLYKYPALLPIMDWKNTTSPAAPTDLIVKEDSLGRVLTWNSSEKLGENETAYYVIYKFRSDEEIDINNPKNILNITSNSRPYFRDAAAKKDGEVFRYAVTALDRLHNESEPIVGTVNDSGK